MLLAIFVVFVFQLIAFLLLFADAASPAGATHMLKRLSKTKTTRETERNQRDGKRDKDRDRDKDSERGDRERDKDSERGGRRDDRIAAAVAASSHDAALAFLAGERERFVVVFLAASVVCLLLTCHCDFCACFATICLSHTVIHSAALFLCSLPFVIVVFLLRKRRPAFSVLLIPSLCLWVCVSCSIIHICGLCLLQMLFRLLFVFA